MSEGRIVKRTGAVLEPERCRVFIRDHHEGYIGWEQFEENRPAAETRPSNGLALKVP